MSSTLMTTWGEHDAALDHILTRVERELVIFDHDLAALKLDQPQRHQQLQRLLFANPKHRLQIVVQDESAIVRRFPRLLRLHGECPHSFTISIAGEGLAQLADSLLVADRCHALVRFHRDHARSKLIEDDPEAAAPYRRRFDDIVGEGGTPFSARPAGL